MNSLLVTLIVVALYVAYALLLLLIRALIVRSEVYRRWARGKKYHGRPRVIQDFQPTQETAIDFVPASAPNGRLLQRLANNRAASARSAA